MAARQTGLADDPESGETSSHHPPPPPPPDELPPPPPPPPPPELLELGAATPAARPLAAAAHDAPPPAPPECPPAKPVHVPELDACELELDDVTTEPLPTDAPWLRADQSSMCLESPNARIHGYHSSRSDGWRRPSWVMKNALAAASALRKAMPSRPSRDFNELTDVLMTAIASATMASIAMVGSSTMPAPGYHQRKAATPAATVNAGTRHSSALARPQSIRARKA